MAEYGDQFTPATAPPAVIALRLGGLGAVQTGEPVLHLGGFLDPARPLGLAAPAPAAWTSGLGWNCQEQDTGTVGNMAQRLSGTVGNNQEQSSEMVRNSPEQSGTIGNRAQRRSGDCCTLGGPKDIWSASTLLLVREARREVSTWGRGRVQEWGGGEGGKTEMRVLKY